MILTKSSVIFFLECIIMRGAPKWEQSGMRSSLVVQRRSILLDLRRSRYLVVRGVVRPQQPLDRTGLACLMPLFTAAPLLPSKAPADI